MVVQHGQFDDAEELAMQPSIMMPKTTRSDRTSCHVSHDISRRRIESKHIGNRAPTENAGYALSRAGYSPHHPDPNRIRKEDLQENDVLCGRGKGPNDYVGNCRFRKIIADFQQDYFRAKRADKIPIAKRVFEIVRNSTPVARFLRQDPTSPRHWLEVKKEDAIRKISQALREGQKVDRQEREESVKSHSQHISRDLLVIRNQPVSLRFSPESECFGQTHNQFAVTGESTRLFQTHVSCEDLSDCLPAFTMLRNGRNDSSSSS